MSHRGLDGESIYDVRPIHRAPTACSCWWAAVHSGPPCSGMLATIRMALRPS